MKTSRRPPVLKLRRQGLRPDEQRIPEGFDADRPRTRGECRDGVRPCPWVACRHHLLLEINPDSGSIQFNYHADVTELAESCSLDAAERGGMTLEDVGALFGITRERARQIETRALINLLGNAILTEAR